MFTLPGTMVGQSSSGGGWLDMSSGKLVGTSTGAMATIRYNESPNDQQNSTYVQSGHKVHNCVARWNGMAQPQGRTRLDGGPLAVT